jgi:hypothetical protein
LAGATLGDQTLILKRPIHGLDDVVSLEPRSGGASRDSLYPTAAGRPTHGKRSCSNPSNVWTDGAWIVEMLEVLSKTYGKRFSAGALKLKSSQPHAPDPTAALLSCDRSMKPNFSIAIEFSHSAIPAKNDSYLARH